MVFVKSHMKSILYMANWQTCEFLSKKIKNLKKYSLDLYECQNCKLVQFYKLAPLKDMYGTTYGYRTSLSKMMISHIKEKYKKILKMKIIRNGSNILDIGSNDGTFLNFLTKVFSFPSSSFLI